MFPSHGCALHYLNGTSGYDVSPILFQIPQFICELGEVIANKLVKENTGSLSVHLFADLYPNFADNLSIHFYSF